MRRELLLIALLLTIVHPDFAKAQSLTAPSTQKSSRIDLKGLTKKADSGNTAAQFQLGLAYHFGNGVDKYIYEAILWYRMAPNSGDPVAQNNLGHLYQTGPQGVKDLVAPSKWHIPASPDANPLPQLTLHPP